MKYIFDGKEISIPDKEISNLMTSLELSKQEAIETWLADNDYEINEEQEELNKTASKVKINKDVETKKPKKERKKPEIKTSDEKKELFGAILTLLQTNYAENVTVLNENKLISVKIGDKTFKVDIIQSRK
jgi:DNA replication initiation complex subunit (GINS family)